MNKIIVTGLALTKDADPDNCQVCNYDFSWMFEYPSTLLWADRIIVTPTIMDAIEKEACPRENDKDRYEAIAKVIRIFFEQAGSNGLIQVENPDDHVTEDVRKVIWSQAESDRLQLAKMFPSCVELDHEEDVPGSLRIENMDYCLPRVLSIYYSLLLADIWDAKLLLNPYTHTYLKYVLGIKSNKLTNNRTALESFTHILSERFPEIDIRPRVGDRYCWNCNRLEECDDAEPKQIEKRIAEYLKWRDYDEVHQMKEAFENVIHTLKRDGQDMSSETAILQEFSQTEKKLHRQLYKIFPAVIRWTKLATILSIPVIVAGATTQSPVVTGIGAGVAGLSQIAKNCMDILASKNRWVCFKQQCAGDDRHQD